MRPVYETEADRANQLRIACAVAAQWQMELHQLKVFYPIDYAFFVNGVLRCWNEVKCRNKKPHDYYPTVILSQHKLTAGVSLARDTMVPFNFIVEFADGIWYCPLTAWNAHFRVRLAGRCDRGDGDDIEPCACIPAKLFRDISYVNGGIYACT